MFTDKIKIKYTTYIQETKFEKATLGSACFDLVSTHDFVSIRPGEHATINTGIKIELPKDYVGLVCPRSGLAQKYGLTVLNAPGVIDSDFRGEIGVIIQNLGKESFCINKGMRIAQLLLLKMPSFKILYDCDLSKTERDEKGFGSTGL